MRDNCVHLLGPSGLRLICSLNMVIGLFRRAFKFHTRVILYPFNVRDDPMPVNPRFGNSFQFGLSKASEQNRQTPKRSRSRETEKTSKKDKLECPDQEYPREKGDDRAVPVRSPRRNPYP